MEQRRAHDRDRIWAAWMRAATSRVCAFVWDQTPLDNVERALAGFVILTNDEQVLTVHSIVARANVAPATVADIQAVNNSKAERT